MTAQIKTFYSHKTEDLTRQLLLHLSSDSAFFLNQPFGRCEIVVPNSGMQRYLELTIARTYGICSHVNIVYLGGLLWQLYQRVLPQAQGVKSLDERLLTLQLLVLFEEDKPLHADLQVLLAAYRYPKQRYQFAAQVAKLLRLYLTERPELVSAWQTGQASNVDDHRHSAWQRALFQQLSLGQYCRDGLQQQFQQRLGQQSATLPQRIHVFGFHAIPPAQLADLQALSAVCEVYCYTFNPCVDYWQDIVPESVKMAKILTDEDEAKLLTVGNPLLASWGQAGKYYIEQLNEQESMSLSELTSDFDPTTDSTLALVQQTIVQLTEAPLATEAHRIGKDDSISLHITAGIRREVEVLYDNLLALLESEDPSADNSILPSDILVMVPNLRDYAPHIQAVFSRQAIPFSLANQTAAEADSDTQAFLALLQTISNNFLAQSLFECLSEQSIRQNFGLTATHLSQIRGWFANHRYAENYVDDSHGNGSSLEKLLDQLLLAYVGDDSVRLDSRFASQALQIEQQETLEIFSHLMQQFLPFSRLSSQTRTLKSWFEILSLLAAKFLPEKPSGNTSVNEQLIAWFDALSPLAEQSVSFEVVLSDLQALFTHEELRGPFLSGGVSFCAVVPMRVIPAKVIAMLGLGEAFPAIMPKDPLDLRQVAPRWSDNNPYKASRYFFLETLMSAREKLYLSYSGMDTKTADTLPPSSLVSDLISFIEQYRPDFAEQITTRYPLQGFMADKNSYQTLYNTDTMKPLTDGSVTVDTMSADDDHGGFPRHWRVAQLVEAICSPLSFYLSRRLQAGRLDAMTEPLKTHDYMGKGNALEAWLRKDITLSADLQNTAVAPRLADANLLAPAMIETVINAETQALLDPLETVASQWLALPNQPLSAVVTQEFLGEPMTCLFHSTRLTEKGLWQYAVAEANAKRRMTAWVNHVLLNCLPAEPWAIRSYDSTLLTLTKAGEVESLRFSAFATRQDAQLALDDLLRFANAVFEKPYALQWRGALSYRKGSDFYQNLDTSAYQLYSGLASELVTQRDALNDLFAPIFAAMAVQHEK